ncbi:MAG: ABC transporter substrate-binding protein [Planctomycetota bacterium]|nr:ABC transporter substrate-binding protein [Planctomycetota bacterium]
MRCLIAALLLLVLPACGGDDDAVYIYTSVYEEVIKEMQPALEERFPGVDIRWYQAGSEIVAGRLSAEIEAGRTPCDILLTSDPFYYAQLAEAELLLAYDSPAARDVPASLRHAQHAYATVRVPLMVIAVNHDRVPKDQHPTSFADLADPRYAGKLTMPDPLKSGTTFTTVAALSRRLGWEYFEKLRKNDMLSAGGNGPTLHRLETGERPVAIILLENLLPSLQRGAPITVVYPDDGAIPVPSPIAILKSTDQPELAKEIYDFFFSAAIQDVVVDRFMYSPLPTYRAPAGAKGFKELKVYAWTQEALSQVKSERDAIKKRFRAIMR